MFPVAKPLTLFGFTLWLMPYVSPGWRGPVMGALSTPKFHLSFISLIKVAEHSFQVPMPNSP